MQNRRGMQERLVAGAGVLAMGAAAVTIWFVNPSNASFLPVCPLYTLTGLACPGCGLTRGFHALMHGDLAAAMGYNALIPFYFLAFALLGVSLLVYAARGRALIKLSMSPTLIAAVFVVLVTFGVIRNLPWYPFTLLYPGGS